MKAGDDYPLCAPRAAIDPGWFPEVEEGVDRPGSDVASFPLDRADPIACYSECVADLRCEAWTYVRPGVQGPLPRCYLKSPAPAPRPNAGTVSGTVVREHIRARVPPGRRRRSGDN